MTGTLIPLKHVAALNAETLDENTDPDYTFNYVDISNTGRGHLREKPHLMTFNSAPSRARRVLRPGDTILSTVRTYLRAAWTVRGAPDHLVGSTGFVCLRPRANVDPRFLGWVAQSDTVIEEIVARSVGVSYPAIDPSEVGRIKVPLLPPSRQRAIADYLDRETGRIDALIAAKQRMVELIDQRFWSFVSKEIENRPSPYLPLRRWIDRITDGPFGSSLTSSDYADHGARVVRLGNIGKGYFRDDDKAFISSEYFESLLRHRVSPGDLLIAGLGDTNNHVGRACVAPDLGPAIVKADCYCASVYSGRGDAEFLALYLSSPPGERNVAMAARGTTRARINLDTVREVAVPLLPLPAQRKIVSLATAERRRAQMLTSQLYSQITLLKERRQAIITAAVIGQLDTQAA